MTSIDIDSLEQAVQKIVLGLALDPAGSVLEFAGQEVTWVVPATAMNGRAADPWSEEKNRRRCELIHRESTVGLSPVEAVELARLRDAALRYQERVAPWPIEASLRLYEELRTKVESDRVTN